MQRTARRWAAAWCVLVSVGGVPMAAQGAGSEGSGDGVLFPPVPAAYPGTREFHWTIRVSVAHDRAARIRVQGADRHHAGRAMGL